MKNTCLGPVGKRRSSCSSTYEIGITRDALHNAQLTNADESRRERRYASSRARRRHPRFVFGGAG